MTANKDAFPIIRFTFRALTSRVGKIVLVVCIALPLGAWCMLRLSMKIATRRANTLLVRIKQLKPRESTYEDAMRLARDYSGHVGFLNDEPCSPKACHLYVLLGYSLFEPPPRISRINLLRAIGIGVSRFIGVVQVRDGYVTGTEFSAETEANKDTPFGGWLVADTSLTDHFGVEADFVSGRQLGLEEHPNRYTEKSGEYLMARVTPDATAREIERAFDFRLSCTSTLAGCSELGDLLPTACEDYIAAKASRDQNEEDRKYGPCPLRSLARLARDKDNVLSVEVKRVFPVASDRKDLQDVEFQLIEVLKGVPDKHLPRFPMDIEGDGDSGGHSAAPLPSAMFAPGKRIILFLDTADLGFIPYPHCEVVPATEENLGVVRQTIEQLSHGDPISALRDVDHLP